MSDAMTTPPDFGAAEVFAYGVETSCEVGGMPRTLPVANLAVSYLAKCAELRAARAENERLTREREDHKQAAIHANDWAAQAEAEMKQAKADLAAQREQTP